MFCVQVDASGYLVAVDPQPVDVTTCTLVVTSGPDTANSPFAITPEQGSEIGGAVLAIWAIAYVFRLLNRALSTDESQKEF